jgi:hypothetical protein
MRIRDGKKSDPGLTSQIRNTAANVKKFRIHNTSSPGRDTASHTNAYDPTLNPSVSNVFAAAAFRFGHTLVANHLESYDKQGARTGAIPITRTQFEPYAMYDNTTVAAYVRGLTTQPSQAFDTAFAAELTGHLFQAEHCGSGPGQS